MKRKDIKDKWNNLIIRLKAIKKNKEKLEKYKEESIEPDNTNSNLVLVKPNKKKKTIQRNKPWYMDAVIILALLGGFINVGEKTIEYYRRFSNPPTWQVYVIQGLIQFTITGLVPAIRRSADPDIKSGIKQFDKDNEDDDD